MFRFNNGSSGTSYTMIHNPDGSLIMNRPAEKITTNPKENTITVTDKATGSVTIYSGKNPMFINNKFYIDNIAVIQNDSRIIRTPDITGQPPSPVNIMQR